MREDEVLREMLTLPQVAERLNLHRATVNDMVITGRLRGYRLGAHWFVRKSDLDRFAASYRRPKNVPRRRSQNWGESWQCDILRWLLHWHTATTSELDRVLDLHVGNIRKYLTMLEQDGLAKRDEDGYWALTEAGASRAAALPPIEDRVRVA